MSTSAVIGLAIREADYVWRKQKTSEVGTYTSPVSYYGGDDIIVKFQCRRCSTWLYAEETTPVPNFLAKSMEKSDNVVDVLVDCDECGADYQIDIFNGMGGMLVQIDDVPDGEIWFSLGEVEPIEHFFAGISDIEELAKDIIPVADEEQANILTSLLFVQGVALLETFLEDTLTQALRSDRLAFRRFVESYRWQRHSKISIADIYREYEKLPDLVFDEVISRTVFHDLNKVEILYRCAGLARFPRPGFGIVMQIAAKRHVLVHRAGRDRDGNRVVITREELKDALSILEDFVHQTYRTLPSSLKRKSGDDNDEDMES